MVAVVAQDEAGIVGERHHLPRHDVVGLNMFEGQVSLLQVPRDPLRDRVLAARRRSAAIEAVATLGHV
jgi:hypothetical protein